MANDVKWIKMMVGMFDGMSFKKIKRAKIGGESFRDKLTAVWFELMDFAGKCNHNGAFIGPTEIPFTELSDIATMIDRDAEELELCMAFFVREGMVTIIDDVYCLSNWAEYQSSEEMAYIREQNRLRKQRQRARMKLLSENSCECHADVTGRSRDQERDSKRDSGVTVTLRDKEKDKDKEREKEKEIYKEKENVTSAAPQSDATPPVISLLLNDGSLFGIHQDKIDRWAQLYPAVDIMTELRKMAGWCEANPSNRKTRNGILRFITNWLSRSQDRAKPEKADADKPFQYDYGDMGWSM